MIYLFKPGGALGKINKSVKAGLSASVRSLAGKDKEKGPSEADKAAAATEAAEVAAKAAADEAARRAAAVEQAQSTGFQSTVLASSQAQEDLKKKTLLGA